MPAGPKLAQIMRSEGYRSQSFRAYRAFQMGEEGEATSIIPGPLSPNSLLKPIGLEIKQDFGYGAAPVPSGVVSAAHRMFRPPLPILPNITDPVRLQNAPLHTFAAMRLGAHNTELSAERHSRRWVGAFRKYAPKS